MIGPCCADNFQRFETPNTMIHMDHQIARAQTLRLSEEIIGAFSLFRAAHQPIAQNILLSDDQEIFGLKTVIQLRHSKICTRTAQALDVLDLNQLPMPLIVQ